MIGSTFAFQAKKRGSTPLSRSNFSLTIQSPSDIKISMVKRESSLPAALNQILFETSKKAEEEIKTTEKAEEENEKNKKLYYKFEEIAERYGASEHIQLHRGVGGGAIGIITSNAYHLKTPPVNIEVLNSDQKKRIQIQISEEVEGSLFGGHRSGFTLFADEKEIFRINSDGSAKNWLDEDATKEQRELVSIQILDPLKKRLSRIPMSKRNPGPSFSEAIRECGTVLAYHPRARL